MDPFALHPFTYLTLLTGILLIITGIVFKMLSPKRLTWYNTLPLKPEWQQSKIVQQEARNWSYKPSLFVGLLLIATAFLPLIFPASPVFTFTSALGLITVCGIVLIRLREKHLNRLFDERRNPKEEA